MTLNIRPYQRISRDTADTPAGWQRELWEWLLAVAAMIGGVWVFRTAAQVILDVIIEMWRTS